MLLSLGRRLWLTSNQWEDEDMLAEGIERLGQVIRRMLDEEVVSDDNAQLTPTTDADTKNFW